MDTGFNMLGFSEETNYTSHFDPETSHFSLFELETAENRVGGNSLGEQVLSSQQVNYGINPRTFVADDMPDFMARWDKFSYFCWDEHGADKQTPEHKFWAGKNLVAYLSKAQFSPPQILYQRGWGSYSKMFEMDGGGVDLF